MIEVEIKLPIQDRAVIAEKLIAQGFEKIEEIRETDIYFDNEAGQIRTGGEALRVRRIDDLLSGKKEAVLTFKGRKLDQISMSRRELETSVGDGMIAEQMLEALGFHPVLPKVEKVRVSYRAGEIRADLDHVQGLGDFLELEILTEEKEKALNEISHVLKNLGYSIMDTVTTSYLSMLQKSER